MSILEQVASRIIKEQERIIGPLAWREASKVNGIHVVDQKAGEIVLQDGDSRGVIDNLVAQYDRLFGRASREVCREAAAPLIASLGPSEIPASLR